jgi:hypothetical protein
MHARLNIKISFADLASGKTINPVHAADRGLAESG